jgi:predicted nuclease with TOPRIM domain
VHEYAPLAITLVAIFAGILVNKSDLNSLKVDIAARFERTDKQFERVDKQFERVDRQIEAVTDRLLTIESDLRQFYSITGELKGRVDALEKRR